MYSDGLIYQDSRMSTEQEFIESMKSFRMDEDSCHWRGGPILFREGKKVFVDDSESHMLVIGDTGSMKTLRYVLPLIYSCAKGNESMVIVDPKGELAKKMIPFLKEHGYKTPVINLRSPQISPDNWNPMGRIQQSYEGKTQYDHENAVLQLNDLFDELFYSRSEADKDKYWNETAGQFALGICELMEAIGEELTIKNLLKWRYEKMRDGTLQSYFDTLPKDSTIYQNLAGYMSLTAENTKSCILSTFDQLVRVFKASSALTNMLSKSSFDMKKIGTEKVCKQSSKIQKFSPENAEFFGVNFLL